MYQAYQEVYDVVDYETHELLTTCYDLHEAAQAEHMSYARTDTTIIVRTVFMLAPVSMVEQAKAMMQLDMHRCDVHMMCIDLTHIELDEFIF
jgi:hypothetical protein